MEITLTCSHCGSGVHVLPTEGASAITCEVCDACLPLKFDGEHLQGRLNHCPSCTRDDFYQQKDFSRKWGVGLFIVAAILSFWTYGISLIALYLLDLFLFQKIGNIAICYHCQAIFRGVQNLDEIPPFDHQKHDRIRYPKAKAQI